MLVRFVLAALLILLAACNLIQANTPTTPLPTPDKTAVLTVAWAEAGNLLVWRQGEAMPRRVASGGVVRPYVAPDGQHIAFTRGPEGRTETLWVVDFAGTAEQQLVGEDDMRPAGSGGMPIIGDVGWYDESVLYFNTAVQMPMGQERRDDLYRANIRTREVALIMRPSEGGAFTFSPDGKQIALVYPGTYGRQDGRIRAIDPLAQEEPNNLLFFVGVATGSEYKFYPRLFWTPDSSAVYVAIPDKDAVYNDGADAPPVALWRLGLDKTREVIGQVPASFFGLPQWSSDTQVLTYVQRLGETTSNQFEIITAGTNGEAATRYAGGSAGAVQPPLWIPGTQRFVFAQGQPGESWLGGPGLTPERLPNAEETMLLPVFAGGSTYVFTTSQGATTTELRYAQLSEVGSPSTLIAVVSAGFPVYDAVVTP